jgi:hypothetical protein
VTKHRVLPVRYHEPTMAYEARCPDCKEMAFMLTLEYQQALGLKVPFLAPHDCQFLPCSCAVDPYTCMQGRALVQAIHDRKTAQGDDFVRNA